MIRFLTAICFGLFASNLALAGGGGRVGNGGGGWVCRNQAGAIRWSESVDLYEAVAQYGLTIKDYTGTYQQIVDQVKDRLNFHQIAWMFPNFEPSISELNYLASAPRKVIYINSRLPVIDDALYTQIPPQSVCSGGTIRYEQIVNYRHDGIILIQRQLFESLSDLSKAALIVHEGVYSYRRLSGDTNSLNSRRIVGLAFSDLPQAQINPGMLYLPHNGFVTAGNYRFTATLLKRDGSAQPLGPGKILIDAYAPDESIPPIPHPVSFSTNLDKAGEATIHVFYQQASVLLANVKLKLGSVEFSGPLPASGWSEDLSSNGAPTSLYSCSMFLLFNSASGLEDEFRIVCVESVF